MTKKKSSKKTPSHALDTTVVEEQKPSPAQKKQGSEIDEMFAGKKKKSSKKTPSQAQDTTVVEEQKPSSAQKKQGGEIDEIFAGKKRKKSEAEKTEKSKDITKRPNTKKNKKKKANRSDAGDFADPPSRPRKTTEDGLAIFTEDELGISRADAGNTPLCPFDCSCCF